MRMQMIIFNCLSGLPTCFIRSFENGSEGGAPSNPMMHYRWNRGLGFVPHPWMQGDWHTSPLFPCRFGPSCTFPTGAFKRPYSCIDPN